MINKHEDEKRIIPWHQSIEDFLRGLHQVEDEPAILAPGRKSLSYAGLKLQMEYVQHFLNHHRIGRNDRVAVVLPNGPELVTAFLTIMASATFAPLNPCYREKEDDFYLRDINAKALVVMSGVDSPARRAAKSWGIPIIELTPLLELEAGRFELNGNKAIGKYIPGFAPADDVAVVLHTSGTTARPKLVPLTQRNVFASAHNIGLSLQLTPNDRCLNVMPLFHIHGLIGAVLTSINVYSGVVCSPGLRGGGFFSWVEEFHPTWYTAVPSVHHLILQLLAKKPELAEVASFRFIRSSSSSLPPQVMKRLEMYFDVPVIEAYGMTESSHQVSSNFLPPKARRNGSVGIPVGTTVEITDAEGRVLPQGETGEIVIKGPNVMSGYEHNPKANRAAFAKGWLRTGDEGTFDADGYLYITGRSKEQINLGGLKVSPREIDEALLDHDAVDQAVTFGVPHFRLGETIAAAVVLKENQNVTESELKSFLLELFAPYKVPRLIVFLDKIPQDDTGIEQRIGLYETLSKYISPEYAAPETETEIQLAQIWSRILGIEPIGRYDNFFILGGDSIIAAQTISRIKDEMEAEISMMDLFYVPVLSELSLIVKQAQRTAR